MTEAVTVTEAVTETVTVAESVTVTVTVWIVLVMMIQAPTPPPTQRLLWTCVSRANDFESVGRRKSGLHVL